MNSLFGIRPMLGNMKLLVCAKIKYGLYGCTKKGLSNREALSRLANRHQGKRCFIIGNGPSLNQTDVGKLSGDVVIGCNSLFLAFDRFKRPPDYYTVEDPLVGEDRQRELRGVSGPVKLAPYDLAGFLDGGDFLYVNFLRKYPGFPRYGWDFARQVYWGGTVTYFNLQLATYLGCNPIYLIGVDHSYKTNFKIQREGVVWTSQEADQNHFDPNYFGKGYRWHDPVVERMEAAYIKAQEECGRRGVTIYNATVGGHLEVFPRADYDRLF